MAQGAGVVRTILRPLILPLTVAVAAFVLVSNAIVS